MSEISYPLVVDTLGNLRLSGSRLSVNCAICNKHTMIDLDPLIDRLGEDHGCMDADLRPHFFCADCRRDGRLDRNISFIHHARTSPDSRAL